MKHSRTLIEELPELLGGEGLALSIKEIAAMLGRHHGAVGNLIAILHKRPAKAVHIAGWRRTKGRHTALWKWGDMPDAEPIQNLTNAEVCRQYRSSERGRKVHNRASRRWYRNNNGAERKRAWKRNRATLRAFSEHGVAAIDPLLAAIMGVRK